MRTRNYTIILICLAMILISCKKNTADPTLAGDTATSQFFMQASKNNAAWTGYPQASAIGVDSITIQGSGMFDLLYIKFKFNGVGQYTLPSDLQTYYWTFGEVLIRARYYLRNDVPSTLNVTAYDAAAKTVTGTFDLHLIKTSSTIIADPQNIDFANGTFKVRLSN